MCVFYLQGEKPFRYSYIIRDFSLENTLVGLITVRSLRKESEVNYHKIGKHVHSLPTSDGQLKNHTAKILTSELHLFITDVKLKGECQPSSKGNFWML